jgi:hypothetical protein
VAVAPLAVSAGTNIKVLEAMACGKAIVSTPAGCAGLGLKNGQEALVCSNWQEFAEAVGELLGNAAVRVALGERARQCAVDRFSWDSIADAAYESYLELAGRARPRHDIRKPDGQAAFSHFNGRRGSRVPALRTGSDEAEYRLDLRG